jgi:lycopene beta-cyclase
MDHRLWTMDHGPGTNHMHKHYDYIFTGAGCAGSSLLMRMMREPFFAGRKILIIDQSPKTKNDRTWCFWEKSPNIFEPIVYHRWEKLNFYTDTFSTTLNIHPYQYKMIRGIDLYEMVKTESEKHPNIEWRYETVKSINTKDNNAVVGLENETLTADYIFNSIQNIPQRASLLEGKRGNWHLLQHFKGYLIQTTHPSFNPTQATFMDFRVHQKHGTTFMYCLPVSETTALVEYTLFTKEVLPQEEYDNELNTYIASLVNGNEYRIIHEEYGIIPMTNQEFPLQDKKIIYMGIAGGQAKGSSGYAFQFIQKRTEKIVRGLMNGATDFSQRSFNDKKFHFYDSVLLNVLCKNKMKGAEIFERIFQKNPPERVLRFLDNESGSAEDLRIMASVPAGVFLKAAFEEFFLALQSRYLIII